MTTQVAHVKQRGDGRPAKIAAPVVFCDIGDILGVPVFSPPPPHLESLDVFPYVSEMLTRLRQDGVRLGIISNTGQESGESVNKVLQKSGLADFFEKELLIYSSVVGLEKNSPEIFRMAAEKAKLADTPEFCVFVGESARERSFAAQAGFRVCRELSLVEEVLAPGYVLQRPDISNLEACTEDAKQAGLDQDPGPSDPNDYHSLLGRLEASRTKLPPLYRETVFLPFVGKLQQMGASAFNQILLQDPAKEGLAGLMLDIAQAILQNGEAYSEKATDAFEEVVSDLYDGFLSAQDRKGIKRPDHAVIPPLVKWGNPDFGPYTWPIDATAQGFGIQSAIVNLPPSNTRLGLLAWAALGHETAGHDILHADEGLEEELSEHILRELKKENIGFGLADYWSSRIDETASDVMGILNMGPAAGIGLIGYFRGLNDAFGGSPHLRNNGPRDDPHPADILRGYLAASTVRLLSFNGASAWANLIEQETDRDLQTIRINGIVVSQKVARQSAEIVAGILASRKCAVMQNHALIEIQDWRNKDEDIVAQLRKVLKVNVPLSLELASGVYAAHVVAAAVMEALTKGANLSTIFSRMITILKAMHDKNPSWGPLFIIHPSTISRDFTYKPQPALAIG